MLLPNIHKHGSAGRRTRAPTPTTSKVAGLPAAELETAGFQDQIPSLFHSTRVVLDQKDVLMTPRVGVSVESSFSGWFKGSGFLKTTKKKSRIK